MTDMLRNRMLFLLTEKERAEGRRITQSEIAQHTDLSIQLVGRWLRNDVTKFEADVVVALCNYFDCELSDLLYIDRSQPESER